MSVSSAKYILITLIILMMSYKIWKINRIDFDLDVLDKQIQPIKKSIQPRTAVGIYMPDGDATFITQLQYVLAPVFTSEKITADSLIYIQRPGQPLKIMANYRMINQTDFKGITISLITKVK